MKKLLVCISLLVLLVGISSAQPITTSGGAKSDEIYLKLRKIDLLNQILPLLLTKDQIINDLLPAIDKARERQKAILTNEDVELAKMEVQVNSTYSNAVDKNQYPSTDFLKMVSEKTRELGMRRSIAMIQVTDAVKTVIDKALTDPQKKVMENSFSTNFIDPSKKPEDIPASTKELFFIQRVFLDPLTRELLIAIVDKAK